MPSAEKSATALLPLKERVSMLLNELQGTICTTLEELDGKRTFTRDKWEREGGGGGVARVLQDGAVFEKAGVNFSSVHGALPEAMATQMNVKPGEFYATGLSLVVHPLSPMVPTVHANYRYFEMASGDSWFGGGSDLTPYYLYDEDALHFHATLKAACDRHDRAFYQRCKKSCDEYFLVRHRKETRGVGGIFFDYLRGDGEKNLALVSALAGSFLESYVPIVRRRMEEPWGDRERTWQMIRRGRYVEFNLMYDRGTMFGLETNGRVESILISLPPSVMWRYDFQVEKGSREARLLDVLQRPREWVS